MSVFLEALTPEAEISIGGRQRLALTRFPFKVGRESRMVAAGDGFKVAERRRSDVAPSNDLYLIDQGRRLSVSRAHFQIEQTEDGGYLLRDRGSALGTYVGDQQVGGGDSGGVAELKSGGVIVVGTTESPFVFRFVVSTD